MKIISQFKDYYDYVAHIYGGGDPKIVYDRKRLGKYENIGSFSVVRPLRVENFEVPLYTPPYNVVGYENSFTRGFTWLIACGKSYPLINNPIKENGIETTRLEIFDYEKHKHLLSKRIYLYRHQDRIVEENPRLIELSKKIGHPVFMINSIGYYDSLIIDGNCPILGDLGFAKLYSAEQFYQELSYFISNKMKDSPDMSPPTTMTDKEKINQHGFDVKQSFRHRKD